MEKQQALITCYFAWGASEGASEEADVAIRFVQGVPYVLTMRAPLLGVRVDKAEVREDAGEVL